MKYKKKFINIDLIKSIVAHAYSQEMKMSSKTPIPQDPTDSVLKHFSKTCGAKWKAYFYFWFLHRQKTDVNKLIDQIVQCAYVHG